MVAGSPTEYFQVPFLHGTAFVTDIFSIGKKIESQALKAQLCVTGKHPADPYRHSYETTWSSGFKLVNNLKTGCY